MSITPDTELGDMQVTKLLRKNIILEHSFQRASFEIGGCGGQGILIVECYWMLLGMPRLLFNCSDGFRKCAWACEIHLTHLLEEKRMSRKGE